MTCQVLTEEQSTPNLLKPFGLRPLGARVVIQVVEKEEVTTGGIHIPKSAAEAPQKGLVMAVGPGKLLDSGERQAMDITEGDQVVFVKYTGVAVKFENKEYLVVDASDILAIREKYANV